MNYPHVVIVDGVPVAHPDSYVEGIEWLAANKKVGLVIPKRIATHVVNGYADGVTVSVQVAMIDPQHDDDMIEAAATAWDAVQRVPLTVIRLSDGEAQEFEPEDLEDWWA